MARILFIVLLTIAFLIFLYGCLTMPASNAPGTAPKAKPGGSNMASSVPVTLLITVGLLACAASVALIGLAPGFQKIGMAIIAGAVTLVVGAITVFKYERYIPIIGAATVLGFVAWTVFKKRQIVTELIKTVDVCKDKLTDEAKEHLFHDGVIKTEIQSPDTTAVVKATLAKEK